MSSIEKLRAQIWLIFSHDGDDNSSDGGDGDYEKINSEQ